MENEYTPDYWGNNRAGKGNGCGLVLMSVIAIVALIAILYLTKGGAE